MRLAVCSLLQPRSLCSFGAIVAGLSEYRLGLLFCETKRAGEKRHRILWELQVGHRFVFRSVPRRAALPRVERAGRTAVCSFYALAPSMSLLLRWHVHRSVLTGELEGKRSASR